ncbi:MAG TPA: sigma-54 dependent transcriptional regulator [Blastocatellia bacterium]|nr:sigma-54 dependent transcriptional regulator [Blastocatellia bacterium]
MEPSHFRILVVDDEEPVRRLLTDVLELEGYRLDTAASVSEALAKIGREVYDLVLTDLKIGPDSGMDLVKQIRSASTETEVMMMTAYATVETAVQAMKLGACDYITKPFQLEELTHRIRNVLERKQLRKEVEILREQFQRRFGFENIIGESKELLRVLEKVKKIAPTEATVLITGETGTGKELIAKAIHNLSRRADRPFISINCAAFPEQLLESELFGHAKGAFTGAISARRGLIEEAHGGTLFLDEIGDTPLSIQVKLLRTLEDKTIRRLGENRTITVDVRFIAATNRNLEEAIKRKEFREDLFYRLNVISIHLPPLRARRGDIPLLANHFLRIYSERERKPLIGFTEQALSLLINYDFPGNIRELENIVEQAVAMASGEWITPAELPPSVREHSYNPPKKEIERALNDVERDLIVEAIERNQWNLEKAARDLGMSRTTLWRKMKKYDVTKPRTKRASHSDSDS